ncbi:hypothetical protein BDV06DRAFT_153833 [Aspergillus oleicola]
MSWLNPSTVMDAMNACTPVTSYLLTFPPPQKRHAALFKMPSLEDDPDVQISEHDFTICILCGCATCAPYLIWLDTARVRRCSSTCHPKATSVFIRRSLSLPRHCDIDRSLYALPRVHTRN